MDVSAAVATMVQTNATNNIGMAAMKMALKSDQSAADLLSKAVQQSTSAPPPAGMGAHVDMTV